MGGRGRPRDRQERGQSTLIGVVLVVSLVVFGVTAVLWTGEMALEDARRQVDLEGVEGSMVEFDASASAVARQDVGTRLVRFSTVEGSGPRVRADAGWLNVSVHDPATGSLETVVVNATLGEVAYRRGDTTVAYQGGGVWKRRANGTEIVSAPAMDLRTAAGGPPTLTLPIVTVAGDGPASDRVRLSRNGSPTVAFPAVGDDARSNPIEEGRVVITVRSEYYRAWGRFFRDRTDASVTLDHGRDVVRVEPAPDDDGPGAVVASTAPNGITAVPAPPPTPHREAVAAPSADPVVEAQIDRCETVPTACDETPGGTLAAGTYYFDGGLAGDLDVDATGGNVTMVVDGPFEPREVDVVGDEPVRVYVDGDVAVAGGDAVNAGGDAGQFAVAVHSNGSVAMAGRFEFVGRLYAPRSDVAVRGGGPPSLVNVRGSVIGERVEVRGDPSRFAYDEAVGDADLGVGPAAVETYLHVSVTRLNVSTG